MRRLASNLSAAQTYTEDTPLGLTPIVVTDPDSANVDRDADACRTQRPAASQPAAPAP